MTEQTHLPFQSSGVPCMGTVVVLTSRIWLANTAVMEVMTQTRMITSARADPIEGIKTVLGRLSRWSSG